MWWPNCSPVLAVDPDHSKGDQHHSFRASPHAPSLIESRLPLGAIIVTLALAVAVPAHAQIISPNIRVSSGSTIDNEPDIAFFGDQAVAVWFRGYHPWTGTGYSLDGGRTWSPDGILPRPGPLELSTAIDGNVGPVPGVKSPWPPP